MATEMKKTKLPTLQLNVHELTHLRDLMSLLLPSADRTASQSLAISENRLTEEHTLWSKVSDLCQKMGIPIGLMAPDYVIALTSPLVTDVLRVQLDIEIENDKSII